MVPSRPTPGRRGGARIVSTLGLLLLLAATGAAASDGSSGSDRELWGRTAGEVRLLQPARPRRPKHANNATDPTHGPTNGMVPGVVVESDTGATSNVPVAQLPDVKYDNTRDPVYRAAKAAWKETVGFGPGATDPIVQGEMLTMGTDGSLAAVDEEEAEQQRYAALFDERALAEGTNATHYRHERRRLVPIMGQNFQGINNYQGYAPPDTTGAVGPNHYVQMVNVAYSIYSRTGQLLVGPRAINTLWANSGLTHCATRNDGDPIVIYDRRADRWILSQFTAANPFGQCVAVSTGPDPTGTYYRYFFSLSTTVFYDFPKMGIWRETYYFCFNKFTSSFQGAAVLAINRDDMLNGVASPRSRQFSTNYASLLPADVDSAAQPSSLQGVLISVRPYLYIWKLNIDWANPTAATMTGPTTVVPAAFNQPCAGSSGCVPQLGTTRLLDVLGDRLNFRFAYRQFPTYDAAVVVHSVNALTSGTKAGVRWYELRNLASGTPYIYQQGTYAPDEKWRWMGSIAMDKVGNIAMGYSISSTAQYVSMGITGRLSTDTLGVMTQGETIVQTSGGAQDGVSRWGDYATMNIDPTDDCTFWFTTEYVGSTGWGNWRTKIVSFQLPGCTSVPTSPPTRAPTNPPTTTPPPLVPTPNPTTAPSRAPTTSPTNVPTAPTARPTNRPTPLPTTASSGQCSLPIPIVLGPNNFNTAPASGLNLSTAGTTCNFGNTGDQVSYNSYYYSFTPATTASYIFSTCNNANFDTKLIVATTCDPSQSLLTCNDDAAGCSGYTSITPAVTLNAGTSYYVIIGGWGSSTPVGQGVITVTQLTPAPTKTPTKSPTRAPTRTPTRRPTRRPNST